MRGTPYLIGLFAAVVIVAASVYGAGTVATNGIDTVGHINRVGFRWISDATGNASATSAVRVEGRLLHFVTTPSGAAAPTDNYDVQLFDEQGVDLLQGNGSNRDSAATEWINSVSLGAAAGDVLTVTIANAGSAKVGWATFYWQ